ncbi:MAG: C39 family peptidase [candidate division KSB1 bacterium]|nr:C39 family peptidase [candidate division KSB1 bacterium]MDZ7303777.1 C39 family peptidase [candidate division KSB1 bacterium]MDZ7313036.1 C39 family peptidase [candidate division KSB1 bacterium]
MPNVFISKPHHKQQLDMSCLPACAKMLLDFIGNTIEEATLRELLETDHFGGTPALNILALNASLPEVKAEIHYWSFVDLQEYLEARRHPCIVAVGTNSLPQWKGKNCRHAVIVHGFDDKHIFLNDPFLLTQSFRLRSMRL